MSVHEMKPRKLPLPMVHLQFGIAMWTAYNDLWFKMFFPKPECKLYRFRIKHEVPSRAL